MKFYSNVVCPALIVLLTANFCYGMELATETIAPQHADLKKKLENTLLILQKPKEQDTKLFLKTIYKSQEIMQDAWEAIKKEPSLVAELKSPMTKIRLFTSQLLRNKEEELDISPPVKFTIQIANTLQDLHRFKLDMAKNNEKSNDAYLNFFIDDFIKTAELTSSSDIVFNGYDQELMKYIVDSSFLEDYSAALASVPEEKEAIFKSDYAIIREKLGLPAVVTEPEEPKKEQTSPEVIIPGESKKVAPETLEAESNDEAITRAAIAFVQKRQELLRQQQTEASRKEREIAAENARPQVQRAYERIKPFALLGEGIAYVISKIGAALSWIRALLPW